MKSTRLSPGRITHGYTIAFAIAMAMLFTCSQASARCNRSSLESLQRRYDTVTTIYEANWSDYIKWMACAAVAVGGGGPAVVAVCSDVIVNAISSHLAGSVDRATIIDKIKNGQEFVNGTNICRVDVLTYQCEVCNCRVCIPCTFCSPRANCNDCGEWCVPEPNRHALVLACRRG
jgi:hypothetical protein